LDQEELSAAVKAWGVTWHFNLAEASHHGGVFESLIRPCRQILESISSDSIVPSREVMVTLLTKVERIMINRPLCKVSNDPKDPETLTPAMLLTPRVNWVAFPPGLPEGASYHRANWRLVQHLTNIFWTREYLQTLQKRSKWNMPQSNLTVGDVVLLMNKKFHPSNWPKAIVTATEPGADGFVRTVRVRTSNGTEYHQDVRKLALLEAAGEMSAMVTSKRCLTNNNVSTSIDNSQDTQDTQGTQGMQGTQGTQGMQGMQDSTQLRRSKRTQEK
jgi:hypothetical protein